MKFLFVEWPEITILPNVHDSISPHEDAEMFIREVRNKIKSILQIPVGPR